MKIVAFLVLFTISPAGSLFGQSVHNLRPGPWSNTASLVLGAPIGKFSTSHLAGFGLDYRWAGERFGSAIVGKPAIGFTASAGADFFAGKKITTAGYRSRYDDYFYFHAMAGIIHNPAPAASVSLLAGPTLGMYGGFTTLGWGTRLSGSYFLRDRISIGPDIMYRKHANTNALWTVSIRASYAF